MNRVRFPQPDILEPASGSRRRFLVRAGLTGAALWLDLPGCTPAEPLRIGSHVWPGYEFLFLAHREGWLDDAGIQIVETGSASESLAALADGRIDGAALTLDEVLRGSSERFAPLVVLLFDISAGADVVLAKRAPARLADIRGWRIGVETSALGTLMLNKLLEAAGLNPGDVETVSVTADGHLQAWASDTVDALITYEPSAYKLEDLGALRIFDSHQLPETIIDVLAVSRAAADRKPGPLRSLIAGYFRARHLWQTNPIDSAYRMAGHLGVSANEVARLYRGMELPDLAYNRHLLAPPATEMQAAVLSIYATIPELRSGSIPAEQLFTAQFLPDIPL